METLTSVDGFDSLLGSGKPVVLQFFAAWDSKSEQITAVLDTLRGSHDHLSFARADAEEVHALAARFDIVAVPTVLVVGNDGKAQARVDGADALAISRMVMGVEAGGSGGGHGAGVDAIAPAAANTAAANSTAAKKSSDPEAELAAVHGRCKALVESDKVYLFMKGSPAAPECGFSRQAVALMAKYDLTYSTFDVLSDPEIRAGIKTFGNWPTFPQLYINAKLVGGLDVIKELDEEGEFLAMVPESHGGHLLAEEELNARIAALINSAPVMLFMKGGRWKPYCKFSKRAVALLHSAGVTKFGTFNIFDDEEVRQGIKTFSNWPTFPQLYIRGKLIGGLDVVKELHEEGELLPMLEGIEVATAETDLDARIYDILRTGDIVLVMKGSLAEPKCKFSRAMVEALAEHGVTNVATFDILEDGDVRERIKAFSNWPTFPQLYIKAKLVGGLDVVMELIEDDGLLPMLEGIEYGAAGPSA